VLLRARRQIDEIYRSIAVESESGARKLVNRIEEVIAVLADAPELARVISRNGVRQFRVWPYPYLVYYRVREDVEILQVRHSARKRLSFHEMPTIFRV
jgi:toxin ParE1/3/4